MPEPSVLDNQPWYVKTFVWVGVPTAAFSVLLWFVLGTVSVELKNIETALASHQSDMQKLLVHLEDESEQRWVQIGVTQRICINTSKTDADRLACVSVPRRTP